MEGETEAREGKLNHGRETESREGKLRETEAREGKWKGKLRHGRGN